MQTPVSLGGFLFSDDCPVMRFGDALASFAQVPFHHKTQIKSTIYDLNGDIQWYHHQLCSLRSCLRELKKIYIHGVTKLPESRQPFPQSDNAAKNTNTGLLFIWRKRGGVESACEPRQACLSESRDVSFQTVAQIRRSKRTQAWKGTQVS